VLIVVKVYFLTQECIDMGTNIDASNGRYWLKLWFSGGVALGMLATYAWLNDYKYKNFLIILTIINFIVLVVIIIFRASIVSAVETAISKSKALTFTISHPLAPTIGRILVGFQLVVIVLVWILIFVNPQYYRILISEDGIVENVSAILWAAASVLMILSIFEKVISGIDWRGVLFDVLLLIFFILCCGEEISWGQRIFDLETPALMSSINVQNEITLHNIGSISVFSNLFFIIAVGFFIIMPWLMSRTPWVASAVHALSIPVPHYYAKLVFVLSLVGWILVGLRFGTLGFHPFSFYIENYYTQMDDEIFELFAAFSYFSFATLNFRKRVSVTFNHAS
jgi:hypothetical protein